MAVECGQHGEKIPNRLSVFSVFYRRYSVFCRIVNTDVGIGIGI